MIAYLRAWRNSPGGREKFAAAEAASKARYPERLKARATLRAAVKAGRLLRGPCYAAAGGDCRGPVEAHHDDYGQPLAVVWTCKRHHAALDRARREWAA